jgi:hypothetical protein
MEMPSMTPTKSEQKFYPPTNNQKEFPELSYIDNFSECLEEYIKLRDGVTEEDIKAVEEIVSSKSSRPWSEITQDKKIDLALANKLSEEELKKLFDKTKKNNLSPGFMTALHDLRNAIFILHSKTKEDKYKILMN